MNYHDIDKELAHLEMIFGLISTQDRFPPSYWRKRLRALHHAPLMPTQQARAARLEAALRVLEESEEAVCADGPLRSADTPPG